MRFNEQFSRNEQYIVPGGFFSSRDDIIISTLLGSCIAVALYDLSVPVGGLNHFMLPYAKTPEMGDVAVSAKYGVNAMELLINDILKKDGLKRNLRAKVFGGSAVIEYKKEATYNVPKMNIEFVFDFLDRERIPVDSYSVGGTLARKIVFFPLTAKILMRFSRSSATGLAHREDAYSQKLIEEFRNDGRPIIF